MSKALHERGALEEQYGARLAALKAENDPTKRARLVLELDNVVGERLAHEMEHGVEFMAHHRTLVEA